jgi:hypothetical protein
VSERPWHYRCEICQQVFPVADGMGDAMNDHTKISKGGHGVAQFMREDHEGKAACLHCDGDTEPC